MIVLCVDSFHVKGRPMSVRIEGGSFKAMMGRAEGRWFLCARCGQVAMPDEPTYQCKCANCAELDRGRSCRDLRCGGRRRLANPARAGTQIYPGGKTANLDCGRPCYGSKRRNCDLEYPHRLGNLW